MIVLIVFNVLVVLDVLEFIITSSIFLHLFFRGLIIVIRVCVAVIGSVLLETLVLVNKNGKHSGWIEPLDRDRYCRLDFPCSLG